MPANPDLAFLSLTEASGLIRSREVSSLDLTRLCLERIERLDPALNSFVTVTADSARERAARLDEERERGVWRGPLHGIPIALKDNIDTAGVATTASSAVFADRIPAEDAPVVQRLKEAGAVLLGKLNMHEFAFGTTSLISHYGPVHNPWSLDHIAGGSSGGSAAAVAAGLCYGALGTDTGGSIRLPAACCGIVGLKPTRGRVSNRGVVPLSWTLDHVGPMCRTVADAALMLQAIAGYDPLDSASVRLPDEAFAPILEREFAGLRVGVSREFPPLRQVGPSIDAALATLAALGAKSRPIDLDIPWDAYGIIVLAEARAYHRKLYEESSELYAPETSDRLEGEFLDVEDYIEARLVVDMARHRAGEIFQQVDVLALPTAPVPALPIDRCHTPTAYPLQFTYPFNMLGLPAISVPCGFTSDSLPVGLQIVGPPGGESLILALAHAYEQATDWHTRRPPLL